MIVPAGATQDRPGPGAGAPPPASRPRRLRERTRTTTRSGSAFAGGGRKYETGEQRRNMSRAQLAEPLDALEKWYGRRQAGRCCRCRRGPPGLKAAAAVPGGGEAGTEQHAPSARAGAPAARLRPQGGGGAAPGASPFGCRTGQLPTALPEPSPCGGPPGGRAG
ncbi:unnamed protein product [Prorocentrum cordatum]|uniref:Uncharacterized protein n=1 Tax=Prorocentrum cordatum TaxID=2364126 RepID=A0ABN9Q0I4_9DINO|nr:unnamed protein product [Polarella glacialis]